MRSESLLIITPNNRNVNINQGIYILEIPNNIKYSCVEEELSNFMAYHSKISDSLEI